MGDQETLNLSAVDFTQQSKFLCGFYTFGHHRQAQLATEADNAGQRLREFGVGVAALYQSTVDFQFGERRRHQVHVRAVALAEIILRQTETLDPQAARAGVEIADVVGYRALHQFETDPRGQALMGKHESEDAVGQVVAVEQVRRQVDRNRNVIALFAPDGLGGNRLFQHAPEQRLFETERNQRRQKHSGQQRAMFEVIPAYQCFGCDDPAIVQGLLRLKPGLQFTVVEGVANTLAIDAGMARRRDALAQRLQLINQAAQGGGIHRFRNQPDDFHLQVARDQTGAHQHPS
ncbi:hypothetical protein D3C72_536890 [compost metagenome]